MEYINLQQQQIIVKQQILGIGKISLKKNHQKFYYKFLIVQNVELNLIKKRHLNVIYVIVIKKLILNLIHG